MNSQKQHPFQTILILLLMICLVTGCTSGQRFTPESSSAKESTVSAEYEAYQKESLVTRQSFEELCMRLFKEQVITSSLSLHYTLADPAAYRITDYPITYGDFSVEAMKQDLAVQKQEKAALDALDVNLLTPDQQLTYRILADAYETELSAEGMELYYQPLGPTIGVQVQLPILLEEYAFYTKQDIEDYLNLLAQTDEYFTQILTFEQEKAKSGLFMTDALVDEIIASCEGYLFTPERSFLSETFPDRLTAVADLTSEEIADYTARNLRILGDDFLPAYRLLVDGLTALKGTNINDQGLCYYPNGKAYYEYMVKFATGTTYESIDALKDAIEDQMDADSRAITKILKEHPDASGQLTNYQISLTEPDRILESLMKQMDSDFPSLPDCSYTIKYVPKALESSLSPAFYLSPPIDQSEVNTIYLNRSAQSAEHDLFLTLAHEGYPGHLYQTVYFSQKSPDPLRQILNFPSYSEGWAFYVENYAYSMENGLDPQPAQILAHNASCSLGIHAVLDLYINYYGWTRNQVSDYLKQYYDVEGTDIVDSMYNTLLATPTNYLEYYVGYLEILQMRSTAEKTLKENFHLKDFHTFLLDIGPAPFRVIEPYFKTWLMTYDL
ncbi:MAG: DUF885 domain-containing protein [Hungatella sp.]